MQRLGVSLLAVVHPRGALGGRGWRTRGGLRLVLSLDSVSN
jgi:hypothetical protein